jgi:hypothetical protein
MNIFLGAIKKKLSESDFIKNKIIKKGNITIRLSKRIKPNYYFAKYYDKQGLYMSVGSPYLEDIIYKIK